MDQKKSECAYSDCEREPLETSKDGYCIFHARAEDKNEKIFEEALRDYIREIEAKDLGYDFSGFIFVTTYYAMKTRDLWKINKRLWELSRDTSLCNYAINYLTSFVKNLRKDELREVYTTTARRTIYDALEELLSPETAKEVKRFRGIVDAQLTEEILKIKTELKKQK